MRNGGLRSCAPSTVEEETKKTATNSQDRCFTLISFLRLKFLKRFFYRTEVEDVFHPNRAFDFSLGPLFFKQAGKTGLFDQGAVGHAFVEGFENAVEDVFIVAVREDFGLTHDVCDFLPVASIEKVTIGPDDPSKEGFQILSAIAHETLPGDHDTVVPRRIEFPDIGENRIAIGLKPLTLRQSRHQSRALALSERVFHRKYIVEQTAVNDLDFSPRLEAVIF